MASRPNTRRRLFGRILLWDPAGGTIVDLPSRYVLAAGSPSREEERVRTADGNQRTVNRTHSAEIPLFASEAAEITQVLRRLGCPLKAAFLGQSGADHWLWLEPTRLQISEPRAEALNPAPRSLVMNTAVFDAAIWEGTHLLEGVPWAATTETGGELTLQGADRPGYKGPRWQVPASASVTLAGEASGVDSTNSATIQIELPAWETTLELANPGEVDAKLRALDWDGNAKTPYQDPLTLPQKTWYVELKVTGADRPPEVIIKNLGSAFGVLQGSVSADCNRVLSPAWNETDLVIIDENV